MRTSTTIIAIALLGITPANAGIYTLTFEDLASLEGQTIHSATEQGFTITATAGLKVVGPDSPSYTGKTGLAPLGDWTLTDGTGDPIQDAAQSPIDVKLDRVGPIINYNLTFNASLGGNQAWSETDTGTIQTGGTFAQVPPALPPADSITLINNLGNTGPYQFTEITVLTTPATPPSTVPEPNTLILAAIGLTWSLKTRRTSRRRVSSLRRPASQRGGIPAAHPV